MSENGETFLKYIGGPLFTAAIGMVVFWLQDRFHKRTTLNRREVARAEATETVAFIEKWLQT